MQDTVLSAVGGNAPSPNGYYEAGESFEEIGRNRFGLDGLAVAAAL